MWYRSRFTDRISELQRDNGTVTASVEVPSESVWFDGHFPDAPLLPGVAQLAMVVDILSAALGKPVTVADASRVRFKAAIKPGERIKVEVAPKERNALSWGLRLLKGSEVACSVSLSLADE